MAETSDVERIIGAHEARIVRLEIDGSDQRKCLAEFRAEVRADAAATSVKLGVIHDAVMAARGGWKALSALGAVATLISGVAIAIYHFVFSR